MSNLSQGILERGEAIGEARGEAIGEARGEAIGKAKEGAKFIFNMYEKGYTIEQIADVAEKSAEEVKAIIAQKKPVLT